MIRPFEILDRALDCTCPEHALLTANEATFGLGQHHRHGGNPSNDVSCSGQENKTRCPNAVGRTPSSASLPDFSNAPGPGPIVHPPGVGSSPTPRDIATIPDSTVDDAAPSLSCTPSVETADTPTGSRCQSPIGHVAMPTAAASTDVHNYRDTFCERKNTKDKKERFVSSIPPGMPPLLPPRPPQSGVMPPKPSATLVEASVGQSTTSSTEAILLSTIPLVPFALKCGGDCLHQVVVANPSSSSPRKPSAATGRTRHRKLGGEGRGLKTVPTVVVDGLRSLWTADIRDAVVSLDYVDVLASRGGGPKN